MADQVTNYTCPNCGAPIHFDAQSGKLKCDYCDSTFTVEEVKKHFAEQKKTQKAKTGSAQEAEKIGAEAPNVETAGGDWGKDAEHLKVYHCKQCGAELICDESTAATTCPYCGNPTVMPDQFSMGRKPHYIIPFQCNKGEAVNKLKEYYKGKKLLPNSFSQESHLKEVKGVYVPFWLYTEKVDVRMEFDASKTTSHRQGDYIVKRTRLYDVQRSGNIGLRRIPCDAAKCMPDDLMDSLEPFDYSGMKRFQMEYLPGYIANKYDYTAYQLKKKADRRAVNTACEEIRGRVKGYTSVKERKRVTSVRPGATAEYALMPVWVLSSSWEGKNYIFGINGQTGKVTGNLPVDKGKCAIWFIGVAAIVFAVLLLICLWGVDPESLGAGIFLSIIVALLASGINLGSLKKKMNPVAEKKTAKSYIDEQGLVLTMHRDIYLRTVETRVRTGNQGRGEPPPRGRGGGRSSQRRTSSSHRGGRPSGGSRGGGRGGGGGGRRR